MRPSSVTSARLGTFFKTRVSGVSRLAIIKGNAAFFAPLIGIVPFKRSPPMMRMRSMMSPFQTDSSRRHWGLGLTACLPKRSLASSASKPIFQRAAPLRPQYQLAYLDPNFLPQRVRTLDQQRD